MPGGSGVTSTQRKIAVRLTQLKGSTRTLASAKINKPANRKLLSAIARRKSTSACDQAREAATKPARAKRANPSTTAAVTPTVNPWLLGSQRHGPRRRLSPISNKKNNGATNPCARSGLSRHCGHSNPLILATNPSSPQQSAPLTPRGQPGTGANGTGSAFMGRCTLGERIRPWS